MRGKPSFESFTSNSTKTDDFGRRFMLSHGPAVAVHQHVCLGFFGTRMVPDIETDPFMIFMRLLMAT
jgi:hypothetical protein